MDDEPLPPPNPLAVENEALKAHIAALEADVKMRDVEIWHQKQIAKRTRKLVRGAADPFSRPYDGR
jgi:hypothetical protein